MFSFERDHSHTIHDYDFKQGDLVLVRNTAIEKALNRKMRARYLGPCVVLSQNKGGTYIIAELDGSVFDRPMVAFHVIPYFVHGSLMLPPLEPLLDISCTCLAEMEDSLVTDPEDDKNNDASAEPDLLDND